MTNSKQANEQMIENQIVQERLCSEKKRKNKDIAQMHWVDHGAYPPRCFVGDIVLSVP